MWSLAVKECHILKVQYNKKQTKSMEENRVTEIVESDGNYDSVQDESCYGTFVVMCLLTLRLVHAKF